ncbi:MAG: hypothetical protein LBN34_02815 [Clostridiales Family XIII bacterium]|jgi:hypothetical protein|nr:hypothetical protein [Clostridiales Family XIII bacterium]
MANMTQGGVFGGIEKARLKFTVTRIANGKKTHDYVEKMKASIQAAKEATEKQAKGLEPVAPKLPELPQTVDRGSVELTVQYNPSSIRFESSTEEVPVKGMYENLSGLPNSQTRGASIVLNVELIFDAVQNKDAFHQDSLRLPTAGDLVGAGAKALSGDANKKYTVLPQTNLIIGMITMMPVVKFSWGSQEFDGIVESAQAKFEMFSPKGQPIRSRVSLRIQQVINEDSQSAYWRDKYEDFFPNQKAVSQHDKSKFQNQSVLNI